MPGGFGDFARPVIISNQPIETPFSWLALIGLGGLVVVLMGVLLRRRKTAVSPSPTAQSPLGSL